MQFSTRYQQQSLIGTVAGLLQVYMATAAGQARQQPELFAGRIAQPLAFRNLLLSLHHVVESRFYRPDLWRLMDPVMTSGDELLRMECFSSCASVYARVDLTPNAFEQGEFRGEGTTNVDFNSAFRGHLASLRPGRKAHFELGEQSVKLTTHKGEAVEHKVTLPERWVRGFLQVQAVQRRTRAMEELDRLSARQLISAIPAKTQGPLYLSAARGKARVLPRRPAGDKSAIKVEGAQRLRLLKEVLPDVQKLRVYQSQETGASIWVADLTAAQLTLGVSSAVKHGFSGDGDALRHLSSARQDEVDLVFAHQAARGLNNFSLAQFAGQQDLDPGAAAEIIDNLSIQGLLGFDRDRDRYFYRALPFVSRRDFTPARLKNSRQLLDREAVTVLRHERKDGVLEAEGTVRGKSGIYRAKIKVDGEGYLRDGLCSCQWVQEHGLKRGPCKHLLALRFVAEDQ